LLSCLSFYCGFSNINELFYSELPKTFNNFTKESHLWNKSSPRKASFSIIIVYAKDSVNKIKINLNLA